MLVTSRSNTAQEIYTAINNHINESRLKKSEWYVGITQNVEQRLFDYHCVSKVQGTSWWIHRKALTSFDARQVEKDLLAAGCDGGDGGGNAGAVHVYAYHKTPNTRR